METNKNLLEAYIVKSENKKEMKRVLKPWLKTPVPAINGLFDKFNE